MSQQPTRAEDNAGSPRATAPSRPLAQGCAWHTALRRDWPVMLVATLTLGNGILSILSILLVRASHDPRLFSIPLPYGLYRWSHALTIAFGLVLTYLSLHLFRRRRLAWLLAVIGCVVAAAAHVGRGRVWYLAAAPMATAILLGVFSRRFTVRSEHRSIWRGLGLAALTLLVALAYGAAGFWLLDRNDLGVEFRWSEALVRTLREFALVGNADLVVRTRHALFFLDSLRVFGASAGAIALYSLFRPVAYRLSTLPRQRALVKGLLERYGGTSEDYFKLLPDKSYFFSAEEDCCVAYATSMGVAIALGDPVGRPDALEDTMHAFVRYCTDNDWSVAVHQAQAAFLPLYRRLGLQPFKIGEEAIVDLRRFVTDTVGGKHFRHTRNWFAKQGYRVVRHDPPHDSGLLERIEVVSRSWLELPAHHERGFSLGQYSRGYMNECPLYVLEDPQGQAVAFANVIPSYKRGETTIDLMRHRSGAPHASMDMVFIGMMTDLQARGFETFNLGLAPYAGVGEDPTASIEERAAHQIVKRATHWFSYAGLRDFKGKFDPVWEDRYLVHQGGVPGLARAGLALVRLTER